MDAFGLAPLLLIFPLIGVLFNGLVGRRFVTANRETGEKWTGWFATAMALSSFGVAVLLYFSLHANHFHATVVPFMDWLY